MLRPWMSRLLVFACLPPHVGLAFGETSEKTEPTSSSPIEPGDWLVLPRVGDYRREVFHQDPIESSWVLGQWAAPVDGATVTGVGGDRVVWRSEATASLDRSFSGGYAYAEFDVAQDGVWLLDARGAAAVCLNGQWVVGDPYRLDRFRPPVSLNAGANWVLVHLADPSARVAFRPAPEQPYLVEGSLISPSVASAADDNAMASVLVVNPTTTPLAKSALVVVRPSGDLAPMSVPSIGPLAVYPATFSLAASTEQASTEGGSAGESFAGESYTVELRGAEPDAIATLRVDPSPPADGIATRTFVSEIDGSVQPYAVRETPDTDAVILLLHDAGQTPRDAIARLGATPSATVVAPSGRGPFGTDWEAWSGADAMEALADYRSRSANKDARVLIAGVGMGGHGALHLATTFPDRFEALATHDAWISHTTLGRTRSPARSPSPIGRLLTRPTVADDPLARAINLADQIVSVSTSADASTTALADARTLRATLGAFHPRFAYREASSLAAATRSTLGDLLARRPLADGDTIELAARGGAEPICSGWARIAAPRREGAIVRLSLRRDPATGLISGSTENVRRLVLTDGDFSGEDQQPRVRLDGGRELAWKRSTRRPDLTLERDERGVWRVTRSRWSKRNKGPGRPGGLAAAFSNRPLLVYGTNGSADERAWCEAKARYDAQVFLYRCGGRLDVVADRDFRLAGEPDRNLVFYGNESVNSAARFWLQSAPVHARRGVVEVWPTDERRDARPESGDDLGVVFVAPKPSFIRRRSASDRPLASVALIGGTGMRGMRSTTRLRYFWSGVRYPDVTVFQAGATSIRGEADEPDVRAAGYLGPDWSVEEGELLWREAAL
ncbi:MAG: alpha/beta hydrolase [Planctomycetota bacterium]